MSYALYDNSLSPSIGHMLRTRADDGLYCVLWEFLLTICPLRLRNVTGSPVNPVAIF